YQQMEETLRNRAVEQETTWQDRSTRLQKKMEEEEGARQKMIAEKQAALDQLEKRYKADMEKLERENAARMQQVEQQKNRWGTEHDEAISSLDSAKLKTQEEADVLRESYRKREEALLASLQQREKEFDDYKKNVEIEWPSRFENRVNEIAEKARKQ